MLMMVTDVQTEEGPLAEVVVDPRESAKAANLRYVSDSRPGITRRKAGKGFTYADAKGQRLTDPKELARIKALAIPPAWTDVWISPYPNGHIQATGRDEKGRKQYRYHARWREVRDDTKFGRMIEFGKALPKLREQVDQDLGKKALSKERVLATLVRLLETTYIRIGNEEYARTNKSFGLTTMRCRHISVTGSKVQFKFRGKSGKRHTITVDDPRLARVIKRCQELPGQELFGYLDAEGQRRTITSDDVNQYLHEITGQHFTAKDFRTWGGTVLAAISLQAQEQTHKMTQARKNVVTAIQEVSEQLGNTPAICRKSYVHPSVINTYLEGTLHSLLAAEDPKEAVEKVVVEAPRHGLKPEEEAVLRLLERCREADKAA
ncbi:MAG: topoisomerase [Chloroflexia bacterium]|jgi:DNA topoisomerase-1|nr:topoisomerase [Chloroflexia bacterium]